jgi:CheY-like chemotaxis protein
MRILVVDDTEDSREVISTMAQWLGHEVVQAKSGMEAIKVAFQKKPDLVLMDLMMPDIDGAQAAGALRQISSFVHVPIVMITAFPQKMTDKPEPVWDAFLKKPIRLEDLTEIINRFRNKPSFD